MAQMADQEVVKRSHMEQVVEKQKHDIETIKKDKEVLIKEKEQIQKKMEKVSNENSELNKTVT